MENQEIILDSEVLDTVDNTSSGLGWKLGLGALAVAGIIFGGKKLLDKKKGKKDKYVETTSRPVNDIDDED